MLTLILAGLAGGAIGVFFFGGLWWTIRKGVSAKQPALWFLGSALLRLAVSLAGFYFVCEGHFERLLCCLFGFSASGLTLTVLSILPPANQARPVREVDDHAP